MRRCAAWSPRLRAAPPSSTARQPLLPDNPSLDAFERCRWVRQPPVRVGARARGGGDYTVEGVATSIGEKDIAQGALRRCRPSGLFQTIEDAVTLQRMGPHRALVRPIHIKRLQRRGRAGFDNPGAIVVIVLHRNDGSS